MNRLLCAAASALVATGFATVVQAAVIDFTALSTYDSRGGSSATGSVYDGAVGWTITPVPASGTLTYAGDGPGPNFSLETGGLDIDGDLDGIGVNDDEISFPGQKLRLVFTEAVNLTGFAVLDLFRSGQDASVFETAHLHLGSDTTLPEATLDAFDVPGSGAGYRSTPANAPLGLIGDSFLFAVGGSNDAVGTPDYALAAVSISDNRLMPVPQPAGGILLASALVLLGLRRTARKTWPDRGKGSTGTFPKRAAAAWPVRWPFAACR